MELHSESSIKIDRSVEIDFESPEQAFIFPKFIRLKSWLRRGKHGNIKIQLKFIPSVYVFSELTHDDTGLGVFSIKYISNLIEFNSKRRDHWQASAATFDRKELRPVPESMFKFLYSHTSIEKFNIEAITNKFLETITAASKLKIFYNNSYNLIAPLGESEREFKRICSDYAAVLKSEEALALGKIIERKIEQIVGGLKLAQVQNGQSNNELSDSSIVDFESACIKFLNKAINLHVLDLENEDEHSSRSINYSDALVEEADRLSNSLEKHGEEFAQLSGDIIGQFGEIESSANEKADDIITLDLPPSSCVLRLLRVAVAWIPYWSAIYDVDGVQKDKMIKAF